MEPSAQQILVRGMNGKPEDFSEGIERVNNVIRTKGGKIGFYFM